MHTPCRVTCEVSCVVLFGKMYTPPALGQARWKSAKQRADGLPCLHKPVLARDGQYQKSVCRQTQDVDQRVRFSGSHKNVPFHWVCCLAGRGGGGHFTIHSQPFIQLLGSSGPAVTKTGYHRIMDT